MSVIHQLDCPLCGVTPFEKLFTKKSRDFYQCSKCKLEMQWPLPTLEELSSYYDESFSGGMYQRFASAHAMKLMTAEQRLAEIKRFAPLRGKWLDVGCANGVFVEAAGKHGIEASGVELSRQAVDIGRKRGLDLHLGTIDDVDTGKKFDCITAFDVLEHVTEPRRFLEGIRARLNHGGYAVLTVPNAGGIVRRLMGKRWYFYIPEEHLHYFRRNNLRAIVQQSGFKVIDVGATYKPMTFDYAMSQFQEYNPLIFRGLRGVSFAIPSKMREHPVALPIGELRIVAQVA